MLKFVINDELNEDELIFVFDWQNWTSKTIVRVMSEYEFAEDTRLEPNMTFTDLARLYGAPTNDPDEIDELIDIDNVYGKGAYEHLKTGGTVWECDDEDGHYVAGYGVCPYKSDYEAALEFYDGDLRVIDSIEDFVSFDEGLARKYARKMSSYYDCYDTEELAEELLDADSTTTELRDLIFAGASKDQIITAAKAIDEELADRLGCEIPW